MAIKTFEVVAVQRMQGQVAYVQLSTGSVLTQDDVETFIDAGVEFVVKGQEGQTSVIIVEGKDGARHLRTARNNTPDDNLSSLPSIE